MSQTEPIAVLAGTPVDTQMGVDCLMRAGIAGGLPFPLSRDPREQTAFQISTQAEKEARVLEILHTAMERGCARALVYCNSLSGSVDFPPLAEKTGLRIVTPLDVYQTLAPRYQRLGLIAANAQGLAGIERTLLSANPRLELLGACALPAVLSIEAGLDPAELVERHRLTEVADWFAHCGMEALVLGCTHFPYFKDALAVKAPLPLIDPADEMLRLLLI